jgi:ribosome-binding protein aMBF1 (putative translation factor)
MSGTEQDRLTADEFFADADADPAARAEWERTALARAVSLAVVGYRVEHKLSQRALAKELAMKPSAVARLEAAEHNPSVETLHRLAAALRIRFALFVMPAGLAAGMVPPAGMASVEDVTAADGTRILVAAG